MLPCVVARKRWTYPALAAVSAQGLGAGVSGDANDKLALSRALPLSRDTAQPVIGTDRVIRQRGVVLETDVYQAGAIQHSVYTAANPTGASFSSMQAAPGAMPTVMIPDGQYLFEIAGRYLGGHVKGIQLVGGKGAFKFTNVDNYVNLPMTFEDCVFLDYTECAIGNMSEDAPYLPLKNNTFIATATSIGVAWGGYIDGGVFEDNQFIRNRYHLKLAAGCRATSTSCTTTSSRTRETRSVVCILSRSRHLPPFERLAACRAYQRQSKRRGTTILLKLFCMFG